MTDVRTYYCWNHTSLEELMNRIEEVIDEEGIGSQDIINFQYTSSFVKGLDLKETKNYTGLIYTAVLLYSSSD